MIRLGENCSYQDRYDEACEFFNGALESLDTKERKSCLAAEATWRLAKIHVKDGEYKEALQELYFTEKYFAVLYLPNHKEYIDLYENLALCFKGLQCESGKYEEYTQKAKNVREQIKPYAVLQSDFSAGEYLQKYFQIFLLPPIVSDAIKFSEYDPLQVVLNSINSNCNDLCKELLGNESDYCRGILNLFKENNEKCLFVVEPLFYRDYHTTEMYCPLSELDDKKVNDRLYELGFVFNGQGALAILAVEDGLSLSSEQENIVTDYPSDLTDISNPTEKYPGSSKYRLDDAYLHRIGLGSIPQKWKNSILQSIFSLI